MKRTQMTFYASFWDAINCLQKKDQLPLFRAIVSYGLFGDHKEKLSASQQAFFALMQPVLDSSIRRAESGRRGGSKSEANDKQNESKSEANDEQSGREKEIEKEIEIEIENELEIENDSYIYSGGDGGDNAREATPEELGTIGLVPGCYFGITQALVNRYLSETGRLVRTHFDRPAVAADCRSVVQYTLSLDGGAHIDQDKLDLLDYAMGSAVSAGHTGEWAYIHGIMDRMAARSITSVKDAINFDIMRPDKEGAYE